MVVQIIHDRMPAIDMYVLLFSFLLCALMCSLPFLLCVTFKKYLPEQSCRAQHLDEIETDIDALDAGTPRGARKFVKQPTKEKEEESLIQAFQHNPPPALGLAGGCS